MEIRVEQGFYHTKTKPSFKANFMKSKFLLKSLEKTSENSALVSAGTTLGLSLIARPLAILLTPNSKKKDKQFAASKSIASSLINFGLTMILFSPISNAIDNIATKPEKYLKEKTILKYKNSENIMDKSKSFNFVKQLIKLSPEFFAILPKAILSSILIVPIMKILFNKNNKEKEKNVSFKAKIDIEKNLTKIVENEKIQNFAIKNKDSNFIQHALSIKDAIATTLFACFSGINPKIKKENKKPLIHNAVISTAFTILGGYGINKLTEKPTKNFIKKFSEANKNDPKLYKYLNGIQILKPIMILGGIYYIIIPVISTFLADKTAKIKA